MHVRHAYAETSLGSLLLVAKDEALSGLYFPEHRYPPRKETIGECVEIATDPFLTNVSSQLAEYLSGQRREFDLPIHTAGNALSEQVWTMLREIPYGATTTYGALAERLGNRNLAQRVGQAVGHNPISIVVPCHRVLGADGSLTGFAGGLDRKRALLAIEEPDPSTAGKLF